MLHQRYGIPVDGLESVPDWVTGNQHDGGPPLDAVNLDLDVHRLDLGPSGQFAWSRANGARGPQ